MTEENISQELRSKIINQTRNYFIEKWNQNYMNLAFAVSGCITISDFASLIGIHICIFSYTVGLKVVE